MFRWEDGAAAAFGEKEWDAAAAAGARARAVQLATQRAEKAAAEAAAEVVLFYPTMHDARL